MSRFSGLTAEFELLRCQNQMHNQDQNTHKTRRKEHPAHYVRYRAVAIKILRMATAGLNTKRRGKDALHKLQQSCDSASQATIAFVRHLTTPVNWLLSTSADAEPSIGLR